MVNLQALLNKLVRSVVIATTSGTVNSNITVSRAQCRLLKFGSVVFVTVGMGNVTSAVNTNTVLFTVPEGYRPSSQVTIQGYVGSSEANFTVDTYGQIKQTLTSSVSNLFASGFYVV